MSLVKKPEMTEANREAHRRNGRKSRGAATAAGKERSRAANLRHGYYSVGRDEALRALGENPADLAALIDGAHAQWRPANAFQGWIAERMARLQWRIQRSDRLQESLLQRQVAKAEEVHRDRVLEYQGLQEDRIGLLEVMRQDALRPDFYASRAYVARLTETFRDRLDDCQGRQLLDLLARLRKPPQWVPPTEPPPPEATSDADWQAGLQEDEEADEEEDEDEDEALPVAEGAERTACREALCSVLTARWEMLKSVWDPILAAPVEPLTNLQRDEVAEAVQKQMDLMRRQEESCFREFWRLGSLLIKVQDRATEQEASEVPGPETETTANSQVSGPKPEATADSEVRVSKSEVGANSEVTAAAGACGPEGVGKKLGYSESELLNPHASSVIPARENAGASGDVNENIGTAHRGFTTDDAVPVANCGKSTVLPAGDAALID